MALCKKCGANIPDESQFCSTCGTPVNSNPSDQSTSSISQSSSYSSEKKQWVPLKERGSSGELDVGQLVWAILNIIFCCLPFGIVALVFTIMAKDAPTAYEEEKKIETARKWNLAATISSVVVIILYFILIFSLS